MANNSFADVFSARDNPLHTALCADVVGIVFAYAQPPVRILVFGPEGSGKSSVVSLLIDAQKNPSTVALCNGHWPPASTRELPDTGPAPTTRARAPVWTRTTAIIPDWPRSTVRQGTALELDEISGGFLGPLTVPLVDRACCVVADREAPYDFAIWVMRAHSRLLSGDTTRYQLLCEGALRAVVPLIVVFTHADLDEAPNRE